MMRIIMSVNIIPGICSYFRSNARQAKMSKNLHVAIMIFRVLMNLQRHAVNQQESLVANLTSYKQLLYV